MGQRVTLVFDHTLDDLARSFNVSAKINAAKIPHKLYNTYLDLFRRSGAMHDKLVAVINDGEHQLCMEEGRSSFVLPSTERMEKHVGLLHGIMKSFDPFRTDRDKEGVWLDRKQISGFFKLFSKDYDIVHETLDALRTTEYIRYHKHLRDNGIRYAGPSSLQEVFSVYVGVARVHGRQRAYMEDLAAGQGISLSLGRS